MTVYGFRHLSRLRESNARIHRLSVDIETYERHRSYLNELDEEYAQLRVLLGEAKQKWDALYVPAMEKRQLLLKELDCARNCPERFYKKLAETLRGTSMEVLKSQINALERPKCKDVSPSSRASEEIGTAPIERSSLSRTTGATKGDSSDNTDAPGRDSLLVGCGSVNRHYRSWNLTEATKRVDELENVRVYVKGEMSSIGAQTCELTVKLQKAENELTSLQNAMSLAPEHLYAELEKELAEFKLEGLRRISRAPCETQRPPSNRLTSVVTSTSSSAPSLAYSIGTFSTDVSSLGLEFLKTTQSSLCEVEARFL